MSTIPEGEITFKIDQDTHLLTISRGISEGDANVDFVESLPTETRHELQAALAQVASFALHEKAGIKPGFTRKVNHDLALHVLGNINSELALAEIPTQSERNASYVANVLSLYETGGVPGYSPSTRLKKRLESLEQTA